MAESQSFSLSSLLASLTEIEADLLHVEKQGHPELIDRLTKLHTETGQRLISRAEDQDILSRVHQVALRIQLVAKAQIWLNEAYDSVHANMVADASALLQSKSVAEQQLQSQDLSETLPSYHMRKHFLATLHDPYPSQEDKEALVRATNESAPQPGTPLSKRTLLNVNSLTLWFINARRRSGWSQILRKFARNDRNRMKLLVQAKMLSSDPSYRASAAPSSLIHSLDDVLRDNLGHLTPADKKEFEDDWTSMISWIKYGVKEKVGDWVYDLVAATKKAPPKSGQARAVTTAANRSPARKTATRAQTKPRKAKQRASKTPSMDSNDGNSGVESTPELSMCSTADTSFSSLSSNASLKQYDPFHQYQLQQSPSLNTRGGRKVKALPKRANQKLSAEALYTNDTGRGLTGTCFLVPEERKTALSLASEALAQVSGQTNYLSSSKQQMFPPYDALGQVPFVPRRESLSSNSLSAAFG